MSTENVISMLPTPEGLVVTFRTHDATGQRTYLYTLAEAVKGILSGDDPRQWEGERIA